MENISPEMIVEMSTERKEQFLSFMIREVLTVKKKGLISEYVCEGMKDAYHIIRKIVDPDVKL
jgi:hypothetical protein